jgi:hypothetical protein
MKIRAVLLLTAFAAAAASVAPGEVHSKQDRAVTPPAASDEGHSTDAPEGGMLRTMPHGTYQCALPGDAAGEAYLVVPAEGFRIGTASSYRSAQGIGTYLMRGRSLTFTRGPRKGERFYRLGDNQLQRVDADGTRSKLLCTRLGATT